MSDETNSQGGQDTQDAQGGGQDTQDAQGGGQDTQDAQGGGQDTQDAPKVFTQADVDRAVDKALKTRQAKIEKERAEQARIERGEHAAVIAEKEAENQRLRDSHTRNEYILEHGLAAFRSVLAGVPVDSLDAARKELQGAVEKAVAAQVADKLKHTQTPPDNNGAAPEGLMPHEMTPEQYSNWKAQKGLQD